MVNHPNRKKAVEVEVNHAEQNAKAWYGSIAEMVAALEVDYDRLEELTDERAELCDAISEKDYTVNGIGTSPNDEEITELAEAQKALADWDAENADELRELTVAATIDGDLQKDADAARERIQESPLSVEVRDDWRSPGDDSGDAVEFKILLSTGGPALQIRGELGEHNEPSRAWLEYQDWGTPWTQYFDVEQSTLLAFCSCFYFGE